MNWEAIGAVAEACAALGVLISLIYLARQIRFNSEEVRSNTTQAVLDRSVANYSDALIAGAIPVVDRVFRGKSESDEDYAIAFGFVLRNLQHAELVFLLYKEGRIAKEVMDSYDRKILTYLEHLKIVGGHGADEWGKWNSAFTLFTDSFREHCESLRAQTDA
ncbi:MAG: hypothetical protein ACFHX7_20850 [Pseudomonadota bacterium]